MNIIISFAGIGYHILIQAENYHVNIDPKKNIIDQMSFPLMLPDKIVVNKSRLMKVMFNTLNIQVSKVVELLHGHVTLSPLM